MTEILNKKVEALTFWQMPILCEPVKGGITNLNFLSLIHISEPTSLGMSSYTVFCLIKKLIKTRNFLTTAIL